MAGLVQRLRSHLSFQRPMAERDSSVHRLHVDGESDLPYSHSRVHDLHCLILTMAFLAFVLCSCLRCSRNTSGDVTDYILGEVVCRDFVQYHTPA